MISTTCPRFSLKVPHESEPLWRAIDFEAGKVCYNELGDLYLDKLNKHHLTQNLVHRLERLGYTVTLEQRAA